MEVKIYEIEKGSLPNLKKILESEDTCEIEIRCDKCGTSETKTIKANELKGFEKKKCNCGEPLKVNVKKLTVNNFARNGYILRGAKALGVEKDCSYLYIKAEEDFFKENESLILIDGVKKVENGFEEMKNKIESEEEAAAQGLGGIFG
jgi:hypothetical protein